MAVQAGVQLVAYSGLGLVIVEQYLVPNQLPSKLSAF